MSKYPCSLGNVKISIRQKEYVDSLDRGEKANIVREAINKEMDKNTKA